MESGAPPPPPSAQTPSASTTPQERGAGRGGGQGGRGGRGRGRTAAPPRDVPPAVSGTPEQKQGDQPSQGTEAAQTAQAQSRHRRGQRQPAPRHAQPQAATAPTATTEVDVASKAVPVAAPSTAAQSSPPGQPSPSAHAQAQPSQRGPRQQQRQQPRNQRRPQGPAAPHPHGKAHDEQQQQPSASPQSTAASTAPPTAASTATSTAQPSQPPPKPKPAPSKQPQPQQPARQQAAKQAPAKQQQQQSQSKQPAPSRTPKARTKVVVRHLPPHMTEDDFRTMVSDSLHQTDYFYYAPGHISSKSHDFTHSRAHIAFRTTEALLQFHRAFHGHRILDAQGTEYRVLVEFSPSQRIPRSSHRPDHRENTFERDPAYLDFLKAREAKDAPARRDDAVIVKEPPTTTPLVEYLRQLGRKGKSRSTAPSSHHFDGHASRSRSSKPSKGTKALKPTGLEELKALSRSLPGAAKSSPAEVTKKVKALSLNDKADWPSLPPATAGSPGSAAAAAPAGAPSPASAASASASLPPVASAALASADAGSGPAVPAAAPRRILGRGQMDAPGALPTIAVSTSESSSSPAAAKNGRGRGRGRGAQPPMPASATPITES